MDGQVVDRYVGQTGRVQLGPPATEVAHVVQGHVGQTGLSLAPQLLMLPKLTTMVMARWFRCMWGRLVEIGSILIETILGKY